MFKNICVVCGNEFPTERKTKRCCDDACANDMSLKKGFVTGLTPEQEIRRIEAMKLVYKDPERNRKIGERTSVDLKKYYADPEHCKLRSQEQLKLHEEHPELFDSFKTARRVRWEDSKQHENQSDLMIKRWQEPGYRDNISSRMEEIWRDPRYPWNNIQFREEVESRILKANQVRPNKAEKKLIDILDSKFPDCWKYVGDGSFWIEGKNPDFVNINGKKQLIELFGDYWHKNLAHQSRIELFRKYGFDTLIIWASELKHPEQVVTKLQKFEEA